MLGMVFTELIEMVEDRFSPELADAVLTEAAPQHGGAYTAVGYYDHAEIIAIVAALSRHTGVPVPGLVEAFGEHLLSRFTVLYPSYFKQHTTLFQLLLSIHSHIHVEVRKLYDKATLPSFSVLHHDEHHLRLLYQSPRNMDALALGLIKGAIAHYDEPCALTQEPWQDAAGATGTIFDIVRQRA